MKGIKVYYYALSYNDCSITVHRQFATIFHKCLILLLKFILNFPIMLALCLMLSMTQYAQNNAGILGGFLPFSYRPLHDFKCSKTYKVTTMRSSLINVILKTCGQASSLVSASIVYCTCVVYS